MMETDVKILEKENKKVRKARPAEIVGKVSDKTNHFAGDIGRGLVSGLIGTVAITLSQLIEMKLSKRKPSDTPVETAGKVIGFQPREEEDKEKLNNLVHFAYGTAWGIVRALVSHLGLRGMKANTLHFASIWSAAMIMLPSLKTAPPVKKWGAKAIAIDGLHHAVYALAAGLFFDQVHKYSC